ncbi:aminoglycoside phosphotransferase family protein [Microlunatus speluncae]|uniref:phosphotransferase n=1 Tax=Microlunatus speluncae TaxID=2594267 RepID=UPI0012661633|nr:aminoglycoside phosphotransferase family protein [Microlunatus speluncae]
MGEERAIRIVDGVVRRPAKPWTATVQGLLAHLHRTGLPVPEPLGFDDDHEFVRLVEGEAGAEDWPHGIGLAGVRSAGSLLRAVHDATAGWRAPAAAVWSVPHAGGGVICHGDPKPANLAWRDGSAVGLFDWDGARPGDRISDVAYALIWFTPFESDPDALRLRGLSIAAEDRRARIAALLDGYGWTGPFDVIEEVLRRREQAIDEVEWLGERGHEPPASWVADNWPTRWRAGLGAMRALAAEVEGWERGNPGRV